MAELIPEKQSMAKCLSKNVYKIDFYQREYVWSKMTVEILLDDIFSAFEESYNQCRNSELTKEVLNNFGWYYLNVILTSKEGNDRYIVDGQQRLTTLVLLCSKLFLATTNDMDKNTLRDCIYGIDWRDEVYYLDNDKRKRAMDSIIHSKAIEGSFQSPTEKNLLDRYNDISIYIDNKNLNESEMAAFIYFVLNKLVVVQLEIENYEDTPMIFEVINDRGESLKPFEILKGKLVGALSKTDSQNYSDKWDKSINNLSGNEDKFFATYIKARLLSLKNTAKETKINNEYHRYLFEDNDEAAELGFRKQDHNRINNIKKFIDHDLNYYSALFFRMLNSNDVYMRYCREIFNVDSQYQIIMAACDIDDSEEDRKVKTICFEVDRLNMLLRLNGIYESQKYQDIVYSISSEIKSEPVNNYRTIFNKKIIEQIKERQISTVNNISILEYNNFKKIRYNTATYFYYLLARVEGYICEKINQNPQNDVFYMSTKHSTVNGYHIEHIFSDNETNRSYFKDDEDFNERRNGIGGLLLLKGLDNVSSGNEKYTDKLQTYSHGPVWGHTLCPEFYNANVDFNRFNDNLRKEKGVAFQAYSEEFKPENLEERSKLMFELVKLIWDV